MIPKILHQIWIGPNPIPENCLKYSEAWKKNHPDFEYRLWTNDNLPALPLKVKAQMDRYGLRKKWAFQADILRYFLIKEYGGVYADIDIENYKPITPLLDTKTFIVTFGDKCTWISNSIFGSTPGVSLFTDIIDTLRNEPYHGPAFFGRKVKEYLELPNGRETTCKDIVKKCNDSNLLTAIPSIYFYRSAAKIEKYGLHHALKSWL